MLNIVFVALVLVSVLFAAYGGGMEAVTRAITDSAGRAVDVALRLIGVMAFFLGLMRVAADGGLLRILARGVSPVMRALFPGVPAGHPAMSAMILNIVSNLLGLGNAATPFGIKAMQELDRLNPHKGTASDAMVLFLAINTSGLSLLPSGVIAVRASLGSQDPAGIMVPTWIATSCATLVGVLAAFGLSRLPRFRLETAPAPPAGEEQAGDEGEGDGAGLGSAHRDPAPRKERSPMVVWAAAAVAAAVAVAAAIQLGRDVPEMGVHDALRGWFSYWPLPLLVGGLVLFGWVRGVAVYESLVDGAKEGFQVAVRIIPYLVAIMVMVGMFRASGGMDVLVALLDPLSSRIGLPAEAVPMALLRPLSGSGAFGYMSEVLATHGPDTYLGYLVSTLQGSTETTFYVLAVYFGAVGVRRGRHALPACLLADASGILAGSLAVRWLYGSLVG